MSLADFDGVTIRAPRSDTVYALFTALGAESDDPTGSAFDEAVANGALAGAESSYTRAAGIPGGRPIATGNLTLFPKLNALVANSGAFGGLTTDQQAMLRDAAKRTLDFVVSSTTSDGELAKKYCASVGSIVTASNADLAAFADAARPVYNELEQDRTTKQLIDSIRTLKADATPATTVAPCDNAAEGATTQNVGATIPFGTYTKTATTQEATDMGIDPTIAAEVLGPSGEAKFSFAIEDGRWTEYDYGGPGGTRQVGDLGTYTYDDRGRWITVSESGGCARCIVGYEWTFNNGVLTLNLADVAGHSEYDDFVRLITQGTFTME